jgi:fibro-slime domain-containing protein
MCDLEVVPFRKEPTMSNRQLIARSLLFAAAAPLAISAFSLSTPAPSSDNPPATVTLTGVVRDFKERTVNGGHPDMERQPTNGFAHYCDNVHPILGEDKKPVFKGGGFKVKTEWRNAAGKNICWRLYNASLGDIQGTKFSGIVDTGGIQDAASFNKWYNDDLAFNVSAPLSLTLTRQSNGSYVFDSNTDPACVALGGFFPIENQMFGNPGGTPNRNFHFTFELHTKFTYDADGNQVFSFRGDDDVWVYIDGKLVIDLGGVHGAVEQEVQLNRLGLVDGQEYDLDFFFAERHRTQSNFKITTNLLLSNTVLPTISNAYD